MIEPVCTVLTQPVDLVGCTFLLPQQEDEQQLRATIVECVGYMYIYNKHYSVTYQSQQQLQQSIKKYVNYPIRTITVHVVILIPNSMTMMTTTMTTMMMDSIVAIITTNNAVTGRRNVVGLGIDVSMIVGE